VFEVFVLDYDGDLYDRAIEVRLTRWLRDQWRFAGAAGLIEQMNRDVQRVRAEAGWKVGPGLIVAGR
jgi:riboflavin kinase/FMN adenylyltransferase